MSEMFLAYRHRFTLPASRFNCHPKLRQSMTPDRSQEVARLPTALKGPNVPQTPTCLAPSARPCFKANSTILSREVRYPALDHFIELEDQDEVRDPVPDTQNDDNGWDFVKKDGGEDVNGPSKQGGSLSACGAVDHCKLAVVFCQSSTPTRRLRTWPRRARLGPVTPLVFAPDGQPRLTTNGVDAWLDST